MSDFLLQQHSLYLQQGSPRSLSFPCLCGFCTVEKSLHLIMPLKMGVADTTSDYTRGSCCQGGRGKWKGGDKTPCCPTEYGCQEGIFIWDSSSKKEAWERRKAMNRNNLRETRQNINLSHIPSKHFAFIIAVEHVCFLCHRVNGSERRAKPAWLGTEARRNCASSDQFNLLKMSREPFLQWGTFYN